MESFVIQSNREGLSTVESYIGCFCDENHISNYSATIMVPVLQAVENAIVHGNGRDENKKVRIECGCRNGGVYFLVEDEGNGFDYATYGECPSVDASGKGIFLIKSLADHYEYFNGGSSLRLDFNIYGIEASYALERMAKVQHFFLRKTVEV